MTPEDDLSPFPPVFHFYRLFARASAPFFYWSARRKLKQAKVGKSRRGERAGRASQKRPLGKLLWLHAVSVGELVSILGLINEIKVQCPRLVILVTTTTTTAAEIARKRLPESCIHQFAPLDTPGATKRFLDHWQPDLVAFVESEIWPQQIAALADRRIPLALVNARLSKGSLNSWRRFPGLSKALFGRFTLFLCQSDFVRDGVRRLINKPWRAVTTGDLKKSSDPLQFNQLECLRLQRQIGNRPIWLASSTHQGEEGILAEAHRLLLKDHPDALLILLPRHPDRGDILETLLQEDGWTIARRSAGDTITQDTQIYMADTLGETGLFYALCPIVFVGGTLVPVGGHNPYEPAHLNCAIIHGPLYANFAQAYEDMTAQDASLQVDNAAALAGALTSLLKDDKQATLQANAKAYVQSSSNVRKEVATHLLALIQKT